MKQEIYVITNRSGSLFEAIQKLDYEAFDNYIEAYETVVQGKLKHLEYDKDTVFFICVVDRLVV